MGYLAKHPLFVSIVSGAVVLIFIISFLNSERAKLREVQRANVELTGEFVSELILGTINYNIQTLENLKRRIEETEGDYFDYWEFDAQLILAQNTSFTLVEWIDSTGVIQRVEPERGNERAVGLDILALDYRRDDWLQMKQDSITNLTPYTELVQGGGVFLVDAPLYYNDGFYGSITAGMDFTSDFNEIMMAREMYNLELIEDNGVTFYRYGIFDESITENYLFQKELQIEGATPRSWKLKLTPNKNFFDSQSFLEGNFIFYIRMLFALLFGASVYFMLKAYSANNKTQKALKEKEVLISEIHHRVKNNLAVISGLIEIQMHDVESEELEEILKRTQHRINSIAGVHELLYRTESFDKIPLKKYIMNMFSNLSNVYRDDPESIQLDLKIEHEFLNINQAIPLGLMMSELLTNSFKHAFQEGKSGNLRIELKNKKGNVHVMYNDSGPGFNPDFIQEGKTVGLMLIKTLLQQLDADYETDMKNGFTLNFVFKEQYIHFKNPSEE